MTTGAKRMAGKGVSAARLKKEMALLYKDPPPGISAWVKEDDMNELEAGALPLASLSPLPRTNCAARCSMRPLRPTAVIQGAEGTPYAGGSFRLQLSVPPRYPFEPPKVPRLAKRIRQTMESRQLGFFIFAPPSWRSRSSRHAPSHRAVSPRLSPPLSDRWPTLWQVQFLTPVYHPNIDSAGRICLDILNMPPKGAWKPSLSISTVLSSIQLLMSHPNPDDGLMVDITHQYIHKRPEFTRAATEYTRKHASPEQPSAGPGGSEDASASATSVESNATSIAAGTTAADSTGCLKASGINSEAAEGVENEAANETTKRQKLE